MQKTHPYNMYMFGEIFKQRALEVKRSIGQMPRLPRACFIATPPLVLVKMVILVTLWSFWWMWPILFSIIAIDWAVSAVGVFSARRWAKHNPDKLLNLKWAVYPFVFIIALFAFIRPFLLMGGYILLMFFALPIGGMIRMFALLAIMSGAKPKPISMLRRAIKGKKKRDL